MQASTIPPVETRLHSYRIVKMKPKADDDAGRGFDLKGSPAPSWTRVNNCTEYEKHTNRGAGNLPSEDPEQYEIGQMSYEQEKRLNESIRTYKPERKKSPADVFENLAYAITTSDCDEIVQARAESYLKVARELRHQESHMPASDKPSPVPTERIAALNDYANSIGLELSLGQIELLLRGGQMRIAGSIVSVVGYDELKRVKDNSMDSKTTKLWRHMQLRHSIDSGSIWYDPVGNYAAMLKTLDPLEWARLFGRK
ncbi:hypothetical protein I5679_18890 [Citrobacter koseri]|uniref:hypothetical protein n=1 Tax=Citrobacter koseri TaxID=545 RepID=UPI0019015919|nr:hypothetical protein [Citrobacter koseri]MBJ9818958.1 hypothetical protein [Citrobacter koseri]HBK3302467.1 hypothetical protein [Citrobacter koseri]